MGPGPGTLRQSARHPAPLRPGAHQLPKHGGTSGGGDPAAGSLPSPGDRCPALLPRRPAPRALHPHLQPGRRHPATHAGLLEYSRDRDRFYLYDTLQGNLPVQDPVQHRDLLAEKLKRTGFFIANKAKVNEGGERGTQEEVGFRFFEGAAAGTVMIGDPPDVASFHENFDWPDAVVHLPYGERGEVAGLLDALTEDPQRLRRIRRANVRNSLERREPSQRWGHILEWTGLPPLAALAERRARLQRLAEDAPFLIGGASVSPDRRHSMDADLAPPPDAPGSPSPCAGSPPRGRGPGRTRALARCAPRSTRRPP